MMNANETFSTSYSLRTPDGKIPSSSRTLMIVLTLTSFSARTRQLAAVITPFFATLDEIQ